MAKYVFITGGVVSGLGKGITGASLGRLLKDQGIKVTMQKFDPYLNVDPGTLNPIEHGEVFVTDDGLETDLDLGHYERFIDEDLSAASNVTSGKIYEAILKKERHGDYHGKTTQVIPHVINEIKSRFYKSDDDKEVAIIEIGGTVGDIESEPFIEAIRQFSYEVGKENVCTVLVTLVIYLRSSSEHKSKPTQMAIREMMKMGVMPDVVVCRSELPISDEVKGKIALFANIKKERVIQNIDLDSIYEVPLALKKEGLDQRVAEILKLDLKKSDHKEWLKVIHNMHNCNKKVTIAIIGKYIKLHDAYLSVVEALKHAGYYYQTTVDIKWIDAEDIESKGAEHYLSDVDGAIVPGGFGLRGIKGKIEAITYLRVHKIPFLGICLGMQLALIEIMRNVALQKDADSVEFNAHTSCPIISLMPEQMKVQDLGATMRLGAYKCRLVKDTLAYRLYQKEIISERHRHRYEVNNDYRKILNENGVILSGLSLDGRIVEMIELSDHPFFIATQAHPEFKSRPDHPHPLFKGLIKAAEHLKRV